MTQSVSEVKQWNVSRNFRVIERMRMRIDNVVKDPSTAEALKPYYVWLCKRPVFHDEYSQSGVDTGCVPPRGLSSSHSCSESEVLGPLLPFGDSFAQVAD